MYLLIFFYHIKFVTVKLKSVFRMRNLNLFFTFKSWQGEAVKEEPPDIADEEERDLHTPQPNDEDFR
jgi:hypothetical protein